MTTNANTYTLKLDRLYLCDLELACTCIVIDARRVMESLPAGDYRKEHVLPGTIEKWQRLHDMVAAQIDEQDNATA